MDLLADFRKDLQSIDPVDFVENNLTIKGKAFKLKNCGRDYLHEIYRYIAFESVKSSGVPIIVVKGRQVEMSTTATCVALYFMSSGMFDHATGLHAFPLIKTASRYSAKAFDTMVEESINKVIKKKQAGTKVLDDGKLVKDHNVLNAMWNQTQKDFKGTNTLYIEGAGSNGDRLRGMQIDFLLYDEFQDWTRDAFEVTREALSHSQFGPAGTGLEMYFGTPKEAGSEFHERWLMSDQRYFNLKCSRCGQLQRLTLDNFVREYEVGCISCKKIFDKRVGISQGKWVPTKPENSKKMRGYHIDQLLVPTITREAIDRKLQENSPRVNANEVFGEFYSGAIDDISLAKVIDWTCHNPDTRLLRFPMFIDGYQTVMGIDWGGRVSGEEDPGEGSYTVVTILSKTFEGKYKLEYTERLEVNKLEDLVQRIAILIRKYNCQNIFADHGYGVDKIARLRDLFGKHIKAVFTGGTNLKKGYSFNEEIDMITVDKHYVLEELFNFMQQYNFIFPSKDEEKIDWLWDHICGVEIFSVEQSGMVRKRFKKKRSSQPIDGLMSLFYAFIGMRFEQTNQFTTAGGAVKTRTAHRNMPKPLLAGGGFSRSQGRSSILSQAMGKRHRRQRT
jgi:hypothetical protein